MTSPYLQLRIGFSSDVDSYLSERSVSALDSLGPLGSVNLFVGATNSGKSRLLRAIAKQKQYITFSNPLPNGVESLIDALKAAAESNFAISWAAGPVDKTPKWKPNHSGHLPEQWNDIKKLPACAAVLDRQYQLSLTQKELRRIVGLFSKELRSGTNLEDSTLKALQKDFAQIVICSFMVQNKLRSTTDFTHNGFGDEETRRLASLAEQAEAFLQNTIAFTNPHRIYIPVLRRCIRLHETEQPLQKDLFRSTIAHNYLMKDAHAPHIFTGLQMYDDLQHRKLSPSSVSRELAAFESFLSMHFFHNREIRLVPIGAGHDVSQPIQIQINDKDRELQHVGDGIQAIILLTYPLFTAPDDSWVFIEEPELNLHPGLQRLFLNTILQNEHLRKKRLRMFCTTHSNHLLGLTIPEYDHVAVFGVRRVGDADQFEVRQLQSKSAHLLADLEVFNASVFMANCTIWVEGICDRIYCRLYLAAYVEHLRTVKQDYIDVKEDIHYAFFEYAGSNLQHYLFSEEDIEGQTEILAKINAEALHNRIFLLADADDNERKRQRHEQLQALNSPFFQFQTTVVIEIENLLHSGVLQDALTALLRQTPSFEATPLSSLDYRSQRLGTYLKERLGSAWPESHIEQGGTLSTKFKTKLAAHVAQSGQVKWDTMTNEARQLAKCLYDFIKSHN